MISRLTGRLAAVEPPVAVIECGGVGYEVWLPLNDFALLPAIDEQLQLHTRMVVRDDGHTLYGFRTGQQRGIFDALVGVSGIGPKSALGVMSALAPQDLAAAVENHDVRVLSKAPGIGRKSAERIIIELRGSPRLLDVPAESPKMQQTMQALVALGYTTAKARLALANVKPEGKDVPELVAAALQQLGGAAKSGS